MKSTLPTISVYQDAPILETVERFWMLPVHTLRELFVARYNFRVDEDGDPIDMAADLAWVTEQHPGCWYYSVFGEG